jgi:hypothetical protein
MDHKVFYDEFLEAEPVKEVNRSSLEYMKKNSLVGMYFENHFQIDEIIFIAPSLF